MNKITAIDQTLGAYIKQMHEMAELLAEKDAEIEELKRHSNAIPTAQPEKKSYKKKIVTYENYTYDDCKSNGVRKARPADSIRSYDDFAKIQQYFLDKKDVRDWAMWTVGVSLGLRVSDLFSLRFKNVLEDDRMTFKDRIKVYEKKTGKLQNCLITESVKRAIYRHMTDLRWKFSTEDFIFSSKTTGGRIDEKQGWRILSNAGKDLDLPLNIGSHTMRKSFANIAACLDNSTIDMNTITKVQGLLNHSDQRTTMQYLGSFQTMFDNAREAVSDFCLGKTKVKVITAGSQNLISDLLERIDMLEEKLKAK